MAIEKALRKRILTFGVFDLFHYGHKELFRKAKELGGPDCWLVVAVHDGEWIKKFKPDAEIVYSTQERLEMVQQCRYVDEAVLYQTVDQGVRDIPFDVLLLGADHGGHDAWKAALAWRAEHGKSVIRTTRTDGISSTILRDRIRRLA